MNGWGNTDAKGSAYMRICIRSAATLLLTLVIGSLPILSACSTGSAPVTPAETPTLLSIYRTQLDDEWQRDLSQWLGLSYVEKDEATWLQAWTEYIQPELYSTLAVLGILRSLDQEVQDPGEIADWISSLRTDEGAFYDPIGLSQPLLMQTDMAVQALSKLSLLPADSDSVVRYVLSLKQPDGLFRNSNDPALHAALDTREARLVAAARALELLRVLGEEEAIPKETLSALEQELRARLPQDSPLPLLTDDGSGVTMFIIRALAGLDPSLVPATARLFVESSLGQVNQLPVDFVFGVETANRLLDCAERLGMPEERLAAAKADVQDYLRTKILPLQNLHGGFLNRTSVEPKTTFDVALLTTRVGLEYPNKDALLHEIDKHRVDEGWAKFFDSVVNADESITTFYALTIANILGFEDYDEAKLSAFLGGVFSDPQATARDVYFSVASLRLLNGDVPTSARGLANDAVLNAAQALPATLDSLRMYSYLVLAADELGMVLPDALKSKVESVASQAGGLGEGPQVDLQGVYYTWTLQRYLGQPIDRQWLVAFIQSREHESGGYRRFLQVDMPGVPAFTPYPDVVTTLYTVQMLESLGEPINHQKVAGFVLASKHQYGFDSAPRELIESTPIGSMPTLQTTYAGLTLLEELIALDR